MTTQIYGVVLAGGKGERFWPLSRARRPKQMLDLLGQGTLLGQAVRRLEGLVPPERALVMTNADLVDAARAAAPGVPAANIIGEPVGRDTAPAIALAAALVAARDPDAVFLVVTADHIIPDAVRFREVLRAACELAAEEEVLVTLGITPRHPATGFGYVKAGREIGVRHGVRLRRVERFVEKPDRATAEAYLAEGSYFWNGGMFVWSVAALRNAFARHALELAGFMDEAEAAQREGRLDDLLARRYGELTKISIDFALMERADNLAMAECDCPWDDVGSWTALANLVEADSQGNVVLGAVATQEARDNIVVSREPGLTALIGVENLIVVRAGNAVLVCPRDRDQDIKKLVQRLRDEGADEVL